MYGGSTTSILLNTPGESGSIVTALEGNEDGPQRARRPGAWPRRRSAPSSPARWARWASPSSAPIVVELALMLGPGGIFLADGAVLRHRLGGARRLGAARADLRCSSGCCLGLVGVDLQTGQPRLHLRRAGTARRHECRRWSPSGCSRWARRCIMARRYHAGKDEVLPVKGSLDDDAARIGSAPWALDPRRGDRLSLRRPAGRRHRDADLAVLLRRKKLSSRSTARSSARSAPSRASPGRKRPTTPRPPACWCRC